MLLIQVSSDTTSGEVAVANEFFIALFNAVAAQNAINIKMMVIKISHRILKYHID